MKKEDIEKAAGKYAEENSWYPGETSYESDIIAIEESFADAFKAGVKWRINSVWHDVDNELPEYNRHVVNEDWFDFTAKDEKDLKRIMNQYPFKRWAYVDDLKPNMEE
ncbi:hypothetical protein [Bacteroides sp.]|uniref:hypothetical protein n=1 Tax=Bacteroides sp. TaxID=29523 RepID=UPI002586F1F3|nr:hypothetical protein [Bacteroides sp.]